MRVQRGNFVKVTTTSKKQSESNDKFVLAHCNEIIRE